MNIKVAFNNTYAGAIHARDFRTPQCMHFGDGSKQVSLSLNLLAKDGHPDYCGILVHNVSGDVRTVFSINTLLTNQTQWHFAEFPMEFLCMNLKIICRLHIFLIEQHLKRAMCTEIPKVYVNTRRFALTNRYQF